MSTKVVLLKFNFTFFDQVDRLTPTFPLKQFFSPGVYSHGTIAKASVSLMKRVHQDWAQSFSSKTFGQIRSSDFSFPSVWLLCQEELF